LDGLDVEQPRIEAVGGDVVVGEAGKRREPEQVGAVAGDARRPA
jgi:hypothetical protein